MKDFFRHNIPAAVAALVLVIALALTLGVNRSVGKLADKVEELYVLEDDKYGAPQKDVNRFCGYLNELYSYAVLSGGDIGLQKAAEELSGAADSPFIEGNRLQSAYETAYITYNRLLSAENTDEQQRSEIIYCFAELQAAMMRLKHNVPYNTAAAEYNEALRSFPAKVLDFTHSPAAVYNG